MLYPLAKVGALSAGLSQAAHAGAAPASFAVFCVYHESTLLTAMTVATRCAEFIEALRHAAELLACVPWNSRSAPTLFINGNAFEAYALHRQTDAQRLEFLLDCVRKSEEQAKRPTDVDEPEAADVDFDVI